MRVSDIADCVAQLERLFTAHSVSSDNLWHFRDVLLQAIRLEQQGFEVKIEQTVRQNITTPSGDVVRVIRNLDLVATRLADGLTILQETTSTGRASAAQRTASQAFDPGQMTNDLLIALERARTGLEHEVVQIRSVFTNVPASESAREFLQGQLRGIRDTLRDLGYTPEQYRAVLSQVSFEFAQGADDAVRPAMRVVFGPNGVLSLVALDESLHSPDFRPAMEVVLGAGGKLADAAADAARTASLEPAGETLARKVAQATQDGVAEASLAQTETAVAQKIALAARAGIAETNLEPAEAALAQKVGDAAEDALGRAGDRARGRGAGQLGAAMGQGAQALGNLMTAIPQLYSSVTQLEEAWKKPLNSTKDYMDLLGALGGVVQQGTQVIQAFSAVMAAANAIAAANPYVLIALAVIALIAAVVALIVYWDQVKAAIRDNPWLAYVAVLFGVIGVIVLLIAYWDEVVLAVLQAANQISIVAKRIGLFFVGIATVVGQVWGWIVATITNAGISILNAFITIGTDVQNFFIGVINGLLSLYNELATSVVGELAGLEPAELIPQVDIETRLIPPREVPQIDVDAAFRTGAVQGGLEESIRAQQVVVAEAQREDEERRRREAQEEQRAQSEERGRQAATGPGAAAAGGVLGLPALPAAAPAGLPGAPGAAGGAGGAGGGVHVEGGITVNINAERLEADAARMLSDEIVLALRERLDALRSESSLRVGNRVMATA